MSRGKELHARYYLVYCQTHPDDWQWFVREWAQIERAWQWCSNYLSERSLTAAYMQAVFPFLSRRGQYQTILEWSMLGLPAIRSSGDCHSEAFVLVYLGKAYYNLGDYKQLLELQERRLQLAHECGNLADESDTLRHQAIVYQELGQLQRAVALYQQALALARQSGHRLLEGDCLMSLGVGYHTEHGDVHKALDLYQQALHIYREEGARQREISVLVNMGIAYGYLGDYRIELEFLEQALVICQECGDLDRMCHLLNCLGETYEGLGETDRAWACYEQGLLLSRTIGARRHECILLGNLGTLYAKYRHDYHTAIHFFQQQYLIAKETGKRRLEGVALLKQAEVHEALEEISTALTLYEQSLQTLQAIGDRQQAALAAWGMGEAYTKLGKYAQAAELMQMRVVYEQEINHVDAERHAARLNEMLNRVAEITWQGRKTQISG